MKLHRNKYKHNEENSNVINIDSLQRERRIGRGTIFLIILITVLLATAAVLWMDLMKAREINITEPKCEIHVNESKVISYTVSPVSAQSRVPEFVSSDKNVAKVSERGVITGVGAGECEITVTMDEVSSKMKVTVRPVVTSIAISESKAELDIGESKDLAYTILPAEAEDEMVYWSSSDEKIVYVDSKGTVIGLAAGKASITATAFGVSDTCEITVRSEEQTLINRAIIGTWYGRYKYDSEYSEYRETLISDPLSMMICFYGNYNCSLFMDYEEIKGTWYYDEKQELYIIHFDNSVGLVQQSNMRGVSNGIFFVMTYNEGQNEEDFAVIFELKRGIS